MKGLLNRLIPDHSRLFDVTIQPGDEERDHVSLVSRVRQDGVVEIQVTANTGVAAAWGIHHYLKYYCKVHVSWEASQLSMPETLPQVNFTLNAMDKFRYQQNVCLYSYSYAFWQWEDWERHIDWMALNGINIPLAFGAQEEIWRRVYRKFGLTNEELAGHFAGPAFLAWGRMGNIITWGGPLSESWHTFTVNLQHKILARMRGLGMTPIIPAFAGHIPKGIIDRYNPVYTTPDWHGFNHTYLLDFSDPMFQEIGSSFITEYQAEFGASDHLYNCDPFNEMDPSTNDPAYLRTSAQAVYSAMTKADPKAIWVLQGWLFILDTYWKLPQIEAFLTSVPIGNMIVLDLKSTHSEQFTRTKSYFGQPFIYNDLSNFGAKSALFGHLHQVITYFSGSKPKRETVFLLEQILI